MKVYRLRNDVNRYQHFLRDDTGDDVVVLDPDCRPRAGTWSPPPVIVLDPFLEEGDFYQFDPGILITSPRATDVLRGELELAGELLPLPYKGKEYTVLNVTECIDCLDQEGSKWLRTSLGEEIYPLEYSFHKHRFTESSLFKIPETHKSEILVVEGLKDPEDEFRYIVESAGLKGLIFQEIWSDEGSDADDRNIPAQNQYAEYPPEIKERFATLLVKQVRDNAVRDWLGVLDGSTDGPAADDIRRALGQLSPQQRVALEDLFPKVVDTTLHYLLTMLDLESFVDMQVLMDTDAGRYESLREATNATGESLTPELHRWVKTFGSFPRRRT